MNAPTKPAAAPMRGRAQIVIADSESGAPNIDVEVLFDPELPKPGEQRAPTHAQLIAMQLVGQFLHGARPDPDGEPGDVTGQHEQPGRPAGQIIPFPGPKDPA